MGYFYFNIAFAVNVTSSLLQINHVSKAIKCAILPTASKSNKRHCTVISSYYLTLDERGCFENCSNLSMKIKHLIN